MELVDIKAVLSDDRAFFSIDRKYRLRRTTVAELAASCVPTVTPSLPGQAHGLTLKEVDDLHREFEGAQYVGLTPCAFIHALRPHVRIKQFITVPNRLFREFHNASDVRLYNFVYEHAKELIDLLHIQMQEEFLVDLAEEEEESN